MAGEHCPPHSAAGQGSGPGQQRPRPPARTGFVALLVIFAGLALGALIVLVLAPRLLDWLTLPVVLILELALALLALGCIAAAVYLQSKDSDAQ